MCRSELLKQGYLFTTDKSKMNIGIIHQFLCEQSYWAKGIPKTIVETSITHSLCHGILHENNLVAFARVITDQATFAILVDVFVLKSHRGKGLSKWLTEEVLANPKLKTIRKFILNTDTAQSLYARFGFKPPARPETFMEISKPNMYATMSQESHREELHNNSMRAKL